MLQGFSASQLVGQIHDKIVASQDLSDNQKSTICEKLAVVESRLLDGANETLQILDMATLLMNQFTKGA